MRFLLDANLPRSAVILLRELGHEVEEVSVVLPGQPEQHISSPASLPDPARVCPAARR
jgi:hypothetical protein